MGLAHWEQEVKMIARDVSKGMRGFAILLVILSHYAAWMFVEPKNPALRDCLSTLGVYGVDIFFAMSGYGLVKSAAKKGITGQYVWNRFKSSYIPYFIVVGTMMLADGVFKSPKDVFSFLTGQDFWFMAVLFAVYIMFMVCYRIGKWKETIFFVILTLYTVYLYQHDYAYFWIVSNMTFFVGVLLATVDRYFEKRCTQVVLLLCGLAGTYYFYHKFKSLGYPVMNTLPDAIFPEIFLSISVTVIVMAVSMLLSRSDGSGLKLRGLSVLGQYSLYIYLLHTRIFYFFMFRLPGVNYYERVAIVATVTIALSLLIGWVYDKCLEKLEKLWNEKQKTAGKMTEGKQ